MLRAGRLLVANLRRSRTGRRLIAVRTNERAAASLGISVFGVKLYAFAVSAALAAVAGILVGFRGQVITYTEFNVFASINASGTPSSAVSATCSARCSRPERDRRLRDPVSQDWVDLENQWDLILGSLLVFVILIFHQNGIADVVARPAACEALHLVPAPERAPLPPARRAGRRRTLSIEGLTVRFGPVLAVDGVSLDVHPGEVVGLIGPNGAGKTTLIDAVTGFVRDPGGSISLDDRRIDRQRHPSGLASACGVRSSRSSCSRTSASRRTSAPAATCAPRACPGSPTCSGPATTTCRRPPSPPCTSSSSSRISTRPPSNCPYGRRRLVGIARTVASGPSVVMLDEPAAGLDENESADLARLIRRLADERNMGVLLVEHDVSLVMSTCDRIVVIDFGRVIASGTPAEIRDDEPSATPTSATPTRSTATP